MGLGRYIGWIALAVLAGGALAYAAQASAPTNAGMAGAIAGKPAAHAAGQGPTGLPRCENPDRAERDWGALVGETKLIPDGPTNTPTNGQVEAIQRFLLSDAYRGWCHDFSPHTDDKRMTGPFIGDMAYGTHSRVTVFYSKGVIDWMQRGRKGAIPDGAMIIKAMYATPAYVPKGEKPPIAGYAVMIRAAKASRDGWLWLLYYVPGNQSYHFEYLTSQYGASFCLSCHAQTSGDDMTFSDLSNLNGHNQVTYVEIGEKDQPADAAHPGAPPIPPSSRFLRDQRTLLGSLIYQPLALPLWQRQLGHSEDAGEPGAGARDAEPHAVGADAQGPHRRSPRAQARGRGPAEVRRQRRLRRLP